MKLYSFLFSISIIFSCFAFLCSCNENNIIAASTAKNKTSLLKSPDTMINKVMPDSIRPQVTKALTFFPQLNGYKITFKFKDSIRKSTMQAQPKFSSIFKKKKNREYVILISKKIQIEDESYSIFDMEDSVMIGWIGHELGHIMDYKDRSALGMIALGVKYLFSNQYIQRVEREADRYAVRHGMADYILKTKDFILNHSDISPVYKARIKRLYLSPEEIMKMVNQLEKEEIERDVDEELDKKR